MDVESALSSLNSSLDDLEDVLSPLFEVPLQETLSTLNTIQQAKLQVLIPYVVHDLVYTYLKTRGINPSTHPVVPELSRIKEYFTKLKNAEMPDKQRIVVDKDAANRFIKHALADAVKAQKEALERGETTEPVKLLHPVSTRILEVDKADIGTEVGTHTRFRHVGDMRDPSEGEDDDLEIIGDEEQAQVPEAPSKKGKRKATDSEISPPSGKKKRSTLDPFAGYSDSEERLTRSQRKRKAKREAASASNTPNQSTPATPTTVSQLDDTPSSSQPVDNNTPKKRKPRKKKV